MAQGSSMKTKGRPPENVYKSWHWGVPNTRVVNWRDPDYPDPLIECGRLLELHFKRGANAPGSVINIAEPYIEKSHLAFDPNHKRNRLYILAPQPVRREVKRMFWNAGAPTHSLRELAKLAGGPHATPDYPNVRVQPIGFLTHVTYLTNKGSFEKGVPADGVSAYIHQHSEDTGGPLPVLATDASGRLWYAGGSYFNSRGGLAD